MHPVEVVYCMERRLRLERHLAVSQTHHHLIDKDHYSLAASVRTITPSSSIDIDDQRKKVEYKIVRFFIPTYKFKIK